MRALTRSHRPALRRTLALLAIPLLLAGCSGTSDFGAEAGSIGIGALVGGLTANPLIGFAAGAGAQIAFSEGVDYYNRETVAVVQDTIARTAGKAPVGESVEWSLDRDLPYVAASGRVQVLRDYGGDIPCREIVFTDDDTEGLFFIATICRAEPAEEALTPETGAGIETGSGSETGAGSATEPPAEATAAEAAPPESSEDVPETADSDAGEEAGTWHWAVAEPSVKRWSGLQ